MILNIVTNTPNLVWQDLNDLWGEKWDITDLGEIAKGIHEFSMVSKGACCVLSVENLLELDISPWNIRIR